MKKQSIPRLLGWLLATTPLAQIFAQQGMELEVIGAAGTVGGNSSNATLHFTVGELMVAEAVNNNILAQGFHQIMVYHIVPVEEVAVAGFEVKIYPNPASEWLTIETDVPLGAALFDLNGRLVKPLFQVNEKAELDLAGLPSGSYFLRATDKTGQLNRSYRVQLVR